MKGAITFSDAIIQGSETVNAELLEFAKASGKPFLDYQGPEKENYVEPINDFYDKILGS